MREQHHLRHRQEETERKYNQAGQPSVEKRSEEQQPANQRPTAAYGREINHNSNISGPVASFKSMREKKRMVIELITGPLSFTTTQQPIQTRTCNVRRVKSKKGDDRR
jgi:hypothetical protein